MIELGHLGMVPARRLTLMTTEEKTEGQYDSLHTHNSHRLLLLYVCAISDTKRFEGELLS